MLSAHARSEDGAITVLSIFFILIMLVLGGLAVDYGFGVQARTKLQVTADASAHAALYTRELESEATAKSVAVQVADANMPSAVFGSVLSTADIEFGVWNDETQSFTSEPGADDAVRVLAKRDTIIGNAVPTFLLRLIGQKSWDIRAASIFTTYMPSCLREGFVAEDIVAIQTDNLYKNGFCIHSNRHVSLNSYNTFEPGTVVSMPDRRNVVLPSDGFATNPGLTEALRDAAYPIRILQRVNDIIAGVPRSGSPYHPDYISSSTPIELSRSDKLDDTQFSAGRIHTINCTSSSQSARIHAGTVLRQVVISTNCQLQFGENVVLEDVVVLTTNTSASSFSGASGVQIGRNDNCAEGGGAQLVTLGGISFPQYLKMYGGQMIGVGDISFSADANGIQGASIISGGRIDGTTGMVMAFCGTGMEDNFEAQNFRLAL